MHGHEMLEVHEHVHLDVVVDGTEVVVPANLGIQMSPAHIATLHTHDSTGIVHKIEAAQPSPTGFPPSSTTGSFACSATAPALSGLAWTCWEGWLTALPTTVPCTTSRRRSGRSDLPCWAGSCGWLTTS